MRLKIARGAAVLATGLALALQPGVAFAGSQSVLSTSNMTTVRCGGWASDYYHGGYGWSGSSRAILDAAIWGNATGTLMVPKSCAPTKVSANVTITVHANAIHFSPVKVTLSGASVPVSGSFSLLLQREVTKITSPVSCVRHQPLNPRYRGWWEYNCSRMVGAPGYDYHITGPVIGGVKDVEAGVQMNIVWPGNQTQSVTSCSHYPDCTKPA